MEDTKATPEGADTTQPGDNVVSINGEKPTSAADEPVKFSWQRKPEEGEGETKPKPVEVTEPTVPEPAPETHVVTIAIEYDLKTQQVTFNGPLADRVMCKGILMEAMRALDEFHMREAMKAAAARGQIPGMPPPPGFRIPPKRRGH